MPSEGVGENPAVTLKSLAGTVDELRHHLGAVAQAIEPLLAAQEAQRVKMEQQEQIILGMLKALAEMHAILQEIARARMPRGLG